MAFRWIVEAIMLLPNNKIKEFLLPNRHKTGTDSGIRTNRFLTNCNPVDCKFRFWLYIPILILILLLPLCEN
jgi:hypothetical protein